MQPGWNPDDAPVARTWRLAFTYLWRAMRLRCPVCGISPIFIPLRRTRRLSNWFTPLDGCPRCGYPYERELGYFLFSQWVLNFGFVVFVSLCVSLVIEVYTDSSLVFKLVCTLTPVPIIGVGIARHAKALFIAIDHFLDPFERFPLGDDEGWGGDDDGDQRLHPPPEGGGTPAVRRIEDLEPVGR